MRSPLRLPPEPREPMPRKLTVEFTCDRCGRIWYGNYTEGEELPVAPSLKATLAGPNMAKPIREVGFEVLCATCFQTVINYVDKLGELKHHSPVKERGAKEEPVAPPEKKKAVKPPRSSSPGSAS